MKIAFGTASAVNMLEAHVGTAGYTRLYQGATKIWPSDRVSKIVFKVSKMDGLTSASFVGSDAWGYFMHANDGLETPASESRYMQLSVGGYAYMLKKTFDGMPLATPSVDKANSTLVISFAKGVGPIADVVSAGKVATLRMVMPARGMDRFAATASTVSKTYALPWIPGIVANVGRTTTANTESLIFTVKDRSNHIWVGINGYTAGKPASVTIKASATGQHPDVVWLGGTDAFTALGGESMTVSFSPLSNVVTAAEVLLSVPAFTKTAELTILSITKE